MDDYDTIFKAICNGATGYLLKDISFTELENKIVSVIEGGGALLNPLIAKKILGYFNKNEFNNALSHVNEPLTDKEFSIVSLLKDGYTYEEIGKRLGFTVNGVRYHIKNIYRKLQVKSRGEVSRMYPNKA